MPKHIKDFTDEEKAAIVARLKKIEPARVAKEFDTTWQVVVAIAKAANKTRTAAIKLKKRAEILARAEEIGVTQAAEKARISRSTIFQWRKKAGMSLKRKSKKVVEKKEVKKTHSSLELENAILRDKVASLTAQVEKLRAAIAKLA